MNGGGKSLSVSSSMEKSAAGSPYPCANVGALSASKLGKRDQNASSSFCSPESEMYLLLVSVFVDSCCMLAEPKSRLTEDIPR